MAFESQLIHISHVFVAMLKHSSWVYICSQSDQKCDRTVNLLSYLQIFFVCAFTLGNKVH